MFSLFCANQKTGNMLGPRLSLYVLSCDVIQTDHDVRRARHKVTVMNRVSVVTTIREIILCREHRKKN